MISFISESPLEALQPIFLSLCLCVGHLSACVCIFLFQPAAA